VFRLGAVEGRRLEARGSLLLHREAGQNDGTQPVRPSRCAARKRVKREERFEPSDGRRVQANRDVFLLAFVEGRRHDSIWLAEPVNSFKRIDDWRRSAVFQHDSASVVR
jgi:hypothetical protein